MYASFRDCTAAKFSVDTGRLKISIADFLNAPALSDGCNSLYTLLRYSNKMADNGLNRVSCKSEV